MHCEDPQLIVLTTAPGGQGDQWVLRPALQAANVDPDRVAYLHLARCRPAGDDFEGKAWKESARRCAAHLARDLARYDPGVPLLVLGLAPLHHVTGNTRQRLGGVRGLWIRTPDGRDAFVDRHPGSLQQVPDPARRAELTAQFTDDMRRMAERLHGQEPQSAVRVTVVTTLDQLGALAERLTRHRAMWAFDIESFDGGAFPSRKEVSTDPCHPDFRLRGVAVAWSFTQGAWLELAPLLAHRARVCELLTPAFTSAADRTAFNGHFDEEGLVVPGWAHRVRRTRDAMLALVSLSDGTHESLRLEKAVVDVLGKRQYWAEVDKGRMRDLPLEQVASGAVHDACATLELEVALDARLRRAEYL